MMKKAKKQKSVSYILKGIDPDLWRQAKAGATIQGKTLKEIFIEALMRYAASQSEPHN